LREDSIIEFSKFRILSEPFPQGKTYNHFFDYFFLKCVGNEIVTLMNEYKPAGQYGVNFSVAQVSRPVIASGVYSYQLRAGKFVQTKKMILLK
jgi:hypothetical protein